MVVRVHYSNNYKINVLHTGLVVEGSNGEYVYLTPEERVEMVRKTKEYLSSSPEKLVLAGSGCECI